MNWMDWIEPDSDSLPLDLPFLNAVKIYGRRLGVIAVVVFGNVGLLALTLATLHKPVIALTCLAILLTLAVLWVRRDDLWEISWRFGQDLVRTVVKLPFPIDKLPVLNLVFPLLENSYRKSFRSENVRVLRGLSAIYKRLPIRPEPELVLLGEAILKSSPGWRFTPISYASEQIDLLEIKGSQQVMSPFEETWMQEVLAYVSSGSSSRSYNRAPRGIAFGLDFLSHGEGQISSAVGRPRSFATTFFLIAFYAHPEEAIKKLENGWQSKVGQLWDLGQKRINEVAEPLDSRALASFLSLVNLASIFLLIEEKLPSFLPRLAVPESFVWPAPDEIAPQDLFLANYLAFSFQKGTFEELRPLKKRFRAVALDRISPIVRIVV